MPDSLVGEAKDRDIARTRLWQRQGFIIRSSHARERLNLWPRLTGQDNAFVPELVMVPGGREARLSTSTRVRLDASMAERLFYCVHR